MDAGVPLRSSNLDQVAISPNFAAGAAAWLRGHEELGTLAGSLYSPCCENLYREVLGLVTSKILFGGLNSVLEATIAGHLVWFSAVVVLGEVLRWAAILLFGVYAARKRSLTAWIVVGMVAGIEFGHDWPARAVQVQFLGTIFLRLIKVIIAPLLFGTLVGGLSGHA